MATYHLFTCPGSALGRSEMGMGLGMEFGMGLRMTFNMGCGMGLT